ncbi:chemotaxis methyl-accepting protein methylase/nitrogen-specific signal transduction histidine kinase [Methanolinea mesophila]|uniref:chemotaxis protein CheB n=1 Tax=Methanolinea mesophila TaxID=547055 RepID=UPI001FD84B36|nr:chemotaxis protein CheB [Methanolinea mesophila]MBP1927482.1 chemotaxis methyl-accepting protein methylase/nitrogen-specific signal transduction histidine kinase [Methanolinea mesophila]
MMTPETDEKKEKTATKQKTTAVSKTARQTKKKKAGKRNGDEFPIVGIGASAGGLEALEQFLSNTPSDTGMAFVIVQHLDPTHKGAMPELLQRSTVMEVQQIEDGMDALPNHVYVIPPNKDLTILHGVLYLVEPAAPRGLRLPIDAFFRTLAEDRKELSIGVILSGMGTDGTMGLRAIKEKMGGVFIQDPDNARFDGMPRSAIEAGVADIIASADELPEKILIYTRHVPAIHAPEPEVEKKSLGSLAKIFILLREHTGNDFSLYKKSSMNRRIERRMAIHQIDKISGYVTFLQENPGELDLLFRELLIGVTSFFRDPPVWDHLRDQVLVPLLKEHPEGTVFRAWIAGCSTGEEAYSLAIVFREARDKVKTNANYGLQVFATDLDADAIEKARQGYYPQNIASDVTVKRLSKFFIEEKSGYRVKKDIREMVIFATQNLIMDPPFTKLDILSCRNLLIYLEPELQKKLIPLFFYSLKAGGVLLLGSAETVGAFTSLFTPIDVKMRIYKRMDTFILPEQLEFPISFFPKKPSPHEIQAGSHPVINLQSQTDRLILNQYAPPAVLTTKEGDILYVNGRTGKFLEPAAGKANWNIFAMAREGLRYELISAFQKAVRDQTSITVRNLPVSTNGGVQNTDCTIDVIKEPRTLAGLVLIVFQDAVPPLKEKTPEKSKPVSKTKSVRVQELEKELQQSLEERQTLREEMQTSQEELMSSNEELQSTNEELQSTNEELTTSKEELQSMNEELQTVNAELQGRLDEFSRASDDMRNLLNSTEIATIFTDDDLNIRRFTPSAVRIIHLIDADEGRPITDINSDLVYPDLEKDAKTVLETLAFVEKEIPTRDKRWFQVRIIPYRTIDNLIDGLVITFIDMTAVKQKEKELSAARKFAEAIISTMREPLLVLNDKMRVVTANRAFYQTFHVLKDATEDKNLYTLGNGQWDIPDLRKLLETILPEKTVLDNYEVRHTFPNIGERVMLLNARQIVTDEPSPGYILLAIEDITNRTQEPCQGSEGNNTV